MTTFEHAMLGSTGAMAVGLHRRGWQIVALAGVAAVLPDWDGLSLVFGAAVFDQVHRAVGHSVFVATVVAAVAAAVEYRMRLMAHAGRLLGRYVEGIPLDSGDQGNRGEGLLLWTSVAVVATWSHLLTDVLFSGHAELSDWGLKLLWPFSQQAYVWPVVHWGDVVPTVLLVGGMFAMLRWRSRVQVLAALTILALVGYIALRASVFSY
jgi:hypothetical protein